MMKQIILILFDAHVQQVPQQIFLFLIIICWEWNILQILQIEMIKAKAYLILIWSLLAITVQPNCIQYSKGECMRCWYDQKLIDGQCYEQIIGCLEYLNPTTCSKCNSTISYLSDRICMLYESNSEVSISIYKMNITLYRLAYSDGFYSIDINEAKSDYYFQISNKYICNGQYKHFISKSSRQLRYIGINYKEDSWNNYKIIYQGSGGGLLLCYININTKTLSIIIKSIVSIANSNVKPHCKDYNANAQCVECQENYHLQGGICEAEIEGCTGYYGPICLRCKNYMVLAENRCVSSCLELSDLSKLRFHHELSWREMMFDK